MSSRKIEDLDFELQLFYERFDALMRAAGIDYIVTCTHRTTKEQDALYEQGRSKPGKIVTNARGGESEHNVCTIDALPASRAFDIVIMDAGKPVWETKDSRWRQAGAIGKSIGLEWAGDWSRFREYPHFQLPKRKR